MILPPVLEPLFKKVAGLQTCNFIKKRLKHKCRLITSGCEGYVFGVVYDGYIYHLNVKDI